MKKKSTLISGVIFIAAFLMPTSVVAGWVDDWMANSTVSAPSYYKGQSRGYVSGGGFSARWKNSSDYLVSVSPPRIKAGCGGIDVFMGGFSFLNADYLVSKLQQILQNAPAVALDLALNVLCEPCAKSMKEFEAMITKLNNLQLDSCKASQAIVAKGMQSFSSDPELGNVISDFETSSGISSFYTQSQKDLAANKGIPKQSSVDGIYNGCDAEFKAIFLDAANTSGQSSLLSNIGKRINLPLETIQLMAGMVGDVGITRINSGAYNISPIQPCEENKTMNVDSMFDDRVYLRDIADPQGKCQQDSGAKSNIQLYVNNMLVQIAGKMEARTVLLPEERVFMDTVSGYGYSYLKYGVSSGMKDSVITQLTPLMAKDITRLILNDLYTKADAMLAKAQEVKRKLDGPKDPNSDAKCEVNTLEPALEGAKDLRERIAKMRAELNDGYQRELGKMNALLTNVESYEKNRRKLEAEISSKLGYKVMMNK